MNESGSITPFIPVVGALLIGSTVAFAAVVAVFESQMNKQRVWQSAHRGAPLPMCEACRTPMKFQRVDRLHGVGLLLAVMAFASCGRAIKALPALAGVGFQDETPLSVLPLVVGWAAGWGFLAIPALIILFSGIVEARCSECGRPRWCTTCRKMRPKVHSCSP